MKCKNDNRSNVHYFDQTRKRVKKTSSKKVFRNSNTVSVMAYCQCCKKQTIKKNKVDDFYLCDKCNNATSSMNYLENVEGSRRAPQYINWEDDLDYLYQHFWLNDK